MALDGVKSNLETTEYELKKRKRESGGGQVEIRGRKERVGDVSRGCEGGLAAEVSVTQELTKKLSAKRDEALEQRNLADKFKRELEQLRSELRKLEERKRELDSKSGSRESRAKIERSTERNAESFIIAAATAAAAKTTATGATKTTAAQPQQDKQQVNWTQERREAEELKTKGNRALLHANKFN